MPYLLQYFDSACVEEMEIDDFWFDAFAFDGDFQISRQEWYNGLLCWRTVGRSASYRGL